MVLSIQFYVYFDEKTMPTYQDKKKHIYAYRRRKRAFKYIEKLGKIIGKSSTKDIKLFENKINDLWWEIQEKLGFFENFSQRHELRGSAIDKKIKSGESRLADPLAYYICPKCGKPGYLFSPNLDGSKLDLYMLHILWSEKKVEFCHLGKTKINQILVLTPPIEGILAFH